MTDDEKFANSPILDETDKMNGITLEEMREALMMLKNGKATSDDNISSELLKICDVETIEVIRDVFNKILSTEKIPTKWLESTIILIHKKGDKAEMKNIDR